MNKKYQHYYQSNCTVLQHFISNEVTNDTGRSYEFLLHEGLHWLVEDST